MPADEMAEHLRSYGLMGQVYDHVADALEAATRDALESDEATPDEESFVFIGGSNFVVAEAMQALKKQ
jgi:dihydrofolate synthase/folylpolyglutamate synthase